MINLKKWMTKVMKAVTVTSLNNVSLVTSGDYITPNLVHVKIYGGVICQLYVRGTTNAAMTANTNYTNCMTVNSALKPGDAAFISLLSNGSGNLPASGTVQLRPQANIASGTTVYIVAMYFLATPYAGEG